MIQNCSKRYGKMFKGNVMDYQEENYTLICDYCEKEVPRFSSFMEAVNYKKENGWKSKNILGEWTDICPECIENKE